LKIFKPARGLKFCSQLMMMVINGRLKFRGLTRLSTYYKPAFEILSNKNAELMLL
jgi:hypothetical protein